MITVEKLEKGTYFDDAFKISFRYDPTTVAKVKELAERRYLPEDRAWEIPAHELPALIEKVGLSNIKSEEAVVQALNTKEIEDKREATQERLKGIKPVRDFDFKTAPLPHQIEAFNYGMDDMVIFGSSKEELHKLKRELDEFMAVNLKQVLKHNWQVFPTKVRGVDFVGYRFFGEYTLLRKSTCKTFKRRMLSISSKRENNVSPTYSEWCSFNSYVGWLQHCDSFRLYQKYVEPNVEYMHNYYLKEVKGNAEICKRKNYSGERKAS